MPKKCILCEKNAKFAVKGSTDFYCEECAKETFGDVSVLVAVEEKAGALKEFLDEKIEKKMNHEEVKVDPDKQFLDD